MGGMGSGNWWRWNTKTTCKEVKRIDIRVMKKNGWLQSYGWRSMSWECGGNPSGQIRYCVDSDGIRLDYKSRASGEDWQHVEEKILFDRTPCNYGGERLWFLCPHCGRRVAVLYGVGVHFLCRECYSLPYASQMKGEIDRLIDKKHGLGRRIFENYIDGYGWQKKKGMHQKTFDRLHLKYQWLGIQVNEGVIKRCGQALDL